MSDPIAYSVHGPVAILRIQNPPVNALSQAVRQGLWDAMDRAEADADIKAVLIVGDGRAFIAGADITEFGKPPMAPALPDLCTRVEGSKLLVVASMHGVSLGGGLEIALGAHYRTAQPSAIVGLPEVHLGLLPGAGGTQRLPRLTGADKAIEVITSGRQIKAAEALELGIIDRVAEGDPQEVGLAYVMDLISTDAPRRAISEMPAPEAIDWDATYDGVLKKGRGQISGGAGVRAVQAASELPFAEGMAAERQLFMEMLASDQSKGMIHAFFNERAVSNLPELKGVEPRPLNMIGIIGGGTMGAGIATAALLAQMEVVLIEAGEEQVAAARGRIEGNLAGALKRGKITQMQYDALTTTALTVAINYDTLSNVDLVIEAVFENMDVKREVFGKLDAVCKPGAILASNTSYLDVDEIAAATSRPQDVIGLHFFSPAHVMKLLEVVVAEKTAADVVATGFALGKRLGKISVRAGVCDGLGYGLNTRAALITRGLAEMKRLGVAMKADPATFSGLSGIGDLLLTCTGDLSRNRTVGLKLGQGKSLQQLTEEMSMVAEGIKTTRSIFDLSGKLDIEMPILEQVYNILYKDKSCSDAVKDLLARDLRDE